MKEKFSQYVARSELSNFQWSTCTRCGETIISATITASQKSHCFQPKPVGGTETNQIYDRHFC